CGTVRNGSGGLFAVLRRGRRRGMAAVSPQGTTVSRNNLYSDPDLTVLPVTAGSFLIEMPKVLAVASLMRDTDFTPMFLNVQGNYNGIGFRYFNLVSAWFRLEESTPPYSG